MDNAALMISGTTGYMYFDCQMSTLKKESLLAAHRWNNECDTK